MTEHRVLDLEGAHGGRAAETSDHPSHHRVEEEEQHRRMVRRWWSAGESRFPRPTGPAREAPDPDHQKPFVQLALSVTP